MRFTVAILALIHVGAVSAFTPSMEGSRVKYCLFSEVAEPPVEAPAETETPAVPQLSRFDRIKANYKGLMRPTSSEGLDFTYDDFDLAVQETSYAFNRNDIVKGTVVQFDNGGCTVDIGAKSSAFLPVAEAGLIQKSYSPDGDETNSNIEDLVNMNEEYDVEIISEEDENGQLLVSVRRIQYRDAWKKIEARKVDDQVFEAQCIGVNRGGAICLVDGLRAFLPGSHLAGQLPTDDLIGQTLDLKFLEVNQEDNKLVVSNRRAVVEKQMSNLSRGDLVSGMVKALKPYGAFIEIGGMSGLLHISQISYDRIDDLEAVLQPGMEIKCMIIDHDKLNGRIALSTKTLEPEPGDMLRDPSKVFELAEDSAKKYHERMEAERKAREEAAKDIVLGLGDSLEDLASDDEPSAAADPLANVSDNLDSVL
jgi:small subunit ribosomal protein S1